MAFRTLTIAACIFQFWVMLDKLKCRKFSLFTKGIVSSIVSVGRQCPLLESWVAARKGTKASLLFCVFYDALLMFVCYACLDRYSIAEIFFIFSVAVLFQIVVVASIQKIWFSSQGGFRAKALLCLIAISFGGGCILEACTLFGSTGYSVLQSADWSLRRIALLCVVVYSTTTVAYIAIAHKRERGGFSVHLKKRYVIIALVALVVSLGIAAVGAAYLSVICARSFFPVFLFLLVILLCAASVFVIYRTRPSTERFFLPLALSVGICIAVIPPAITNMTGDDQIHFSRACGVSYLVDPAFSEGDRLLAVAAYHFEELMPDRSSSSIAAFDEKLEETKSRDIVRHRGFIDAMAQTSTLSLSSFGYIPSAIGLWVGRLLHLPLADTFVLGRVFNMLFYVGVCYAAIRIIPTKKTLLAVVALIPTSILLASNYSYDAWQNALCLLAIAMTVREIRQDGYVGSWNLVGLLVVYFLALAPKAIYFPLIGLLILIPRKRFRSTAIWGIWLAVIAAFSVFVIASFIIPFAFQGAYGNDMRGGEGVNSREQIAFILDNPSTFLLILLSEAFNVFLNPAIFYKATVHFSYSGNLATMVPFFNMVVPLILFFAAITDSGYPAQRAVRPKTKAWVTFLLLMSAALIITSLYVSYNEVGSISYFEENGAITVGGVQERYILPMLFPLLAFVLDFKVQNQMDRSAYSLAMQGSMAVVGWACVAIMLVWPMVA